MSKEILRNNILYNNTRKLDIWDKILPIKENSYSTIEGLKNEDRRRVLRNIGRLTTQIGGFAVMYTASDFILDGAGNGARLVLDEQERHPSASRAQVERTVSPALRVEKFKALGGALLTFIGYKALVHTGGYEDRQTSSCNEDRSA